MSTAKDRIRSDGEPFLDSNDGTDRRARGLQNRQLCWPISVVIPKNCVRSSLGDSSIGSGMRGLTCHSVVSPSGMVETPRLQGSAGGVRWRLHEVGQGSFGIDGARRSAPA